MILSGRPPKGYNDVENQFYLIRLELDNAFTILMNNIESFNRKFDAEQEDIDKKERQFNELVETKYRENLPKENDGEIARAIAVSEAENELNVYEFAFNIMYENLMLLQKNSIDGYHKSSIVMMYSQIEFFFIKLCEILKGEVNSQLNLKDLAGYGTIGKCLVYLEKVVGVKINEGLRDKFLNYQKIRNNIIHDNSLLVVVEGNQIKPVLSLFEGAFTEDDNRYYINDISIVKKFKKDTENFIVSLEAEVEKIIGFKTILKRMRTGLGNSLFERNDEKVDVDGDKFIYSSIINRIHHKEETQKLTITIQKVSKSRKLLDEENSIFKIAKKDEFLKVFNVTSILILNIFKHYKSLINGKNSYEYTMVIK